MRSSDSGCSNRASDMSGVEQYDNLSDAQLIGRLRGGDGKMMDYILDKYKPLVRKKANEMYLIGGENEDLIQEGMIGLFKAIRDYDGEKEVSFFCFAQLCITRQLYSAVEASNRKKHAPLNTYISFDTHVGEDGRSLAETLAADGMDNPEQFVIAQENFHGFFQTLKTGLSGMESEVLEEYLSGRNYRQIAEAMGKSPKAIDNALQRIRLKVRQTQEKGERRTDR